MGLFDGEEVEPSAFQIAMENIFLENTLRRSGEALNFSESVRNALGFKTGDDGSFIRMTDEERFESLDPVARQNAEILKLQSDRLTKALKGELPVSEALRQRSEDQADVTQEALARRGHGIDRDAGDRGISGLTGFSTPAIQNIGQQQRTQGLLEDTERRGEMDAGARNVINTSGLLSDFNTRNIGNLSNAPLRFTSGLLGDSLVSADSRASIANAQFDDNASLNSFLGGILDRIL